MVEAPVNRIKHLIREKSTEGSHPPLGFNRQSGGCQPSVQETYVAALQKAMDTLSNLMDSVHPGMQFNAATAMLDFEKTRLRHGRALAGMDTGTSNEVESKEPELTKEQEQERLLTEYLESTSDEEIESMKKSMAELDERYRLQAAKAEEEKANCEPAVNLEEFTHRLFNSSLAPKPAFTPYMEVPHWQQPVGPVPSDLSEALHL
jgi:hypothetical protein